jgi:formamidopyrimidine-DNA glycosylase
MPELPEVETTRRGIAAHILAERVIRIIVREPRLRWPVPSDLNKRISGQHVRKVDRRGKYLLLYTDRDCLIIHLGMSGSLRVIKYNARPEKHDHVDIVFESGTILRYRDPRRFGSFHLAQGDPNNHKLLADLGPEPLSVDFTSDYLFQKSRGRKQVIKNFIMDSKLVVGVGNIYANEALYASGISPKRQAGRVSRANYDKLVPAIKTILTQAIKAGGTTLRDFVSGEGNPGYFSQDLKVYGRAEEPCVQCDKPIKLVRLGQRSSYYCSYCQK